ncbi:MAG: tRNA-dihydrouridine synthase, partial [Xanthomonadaceae bacterium]|nr:tRNA-dihydrouridine synthase [Xanthomonadaceae bacterium]
RLKQEFARLTVIINGGIVDADAAKSQLQQVDGVMLGRAAYHDPYVLARIEHGFFGTPLPAREEILYRLEPYIAAQLRNGEALHHIVRHVLGLYLGEPGARAFRRYLSEHMRAPSADFRTIEAALASLREHGRAQAA